MAKITLESIKTGYREKPIRLVLYGVDGIGKTTFGASAPDPIFLCAEDGQGLMNISRFPIESWDDVLDSISTLLDGGHNYQTVVVDSLDWIESLCAAALCNERGMEGIASFGYGAGYKFLRERFQTFIRGLELLLEVRNMHIILLGHAHIKRFDDPEREPYERYQLKLDESNAAKVREWSDILAFANYDTLFKQVGENESGDKAKRAISYGKRYMHLERSAAFDAKNRYSLPTRILLNKDSPWMSLYLEVQKSISTLKQRTENLPNN